VPNVLGLSLRKAGAQTLMARTRRFHAPHVSIPTLHTYRFPTGRYLQRRRFYPETMTNSTNSTGSQIVYAEPSWFGRSLCLFSIADLMAREN